MKITDILACQPTCASPPDWRTSLGQILVAIEADGGITGYGVGGGGLSGVHIIRTVLRDLLIGQNTEPVEFIWQLMYEATLPFGRKGVAIMALSGVDLALWDLAGKAARRPVAQLLNNTIPLRPTLPTYVTVWDEVPAELVGSYCAFKLHIGEGLPVAAIVEAVE